MKGGEVVGPGNKAIQGGGMYLGNPSTTTFNGVTVSGNQATDNKSPGVYWQKVQNGAATLNNLPGLTDNDDNGKKPFQGP